MNDPAGLPALVDAIRHLHGCEATWVESVPVHEKSGDELRVRVDGNPGPDVALARVVRRCDVALLLPDERVVAPFGSR